MIRKLREQDLSEVMEIWLAENIRAHSFIPVAYWRDHYKMVREMMPQAEVYVYEDGETHRISGFIGLTENYIAGLFVRESAQLTGIGYQLVNHAKSIRSTLSLNVYQKNEQAVAFYRKEGFVIQGESVTRDWGKGIRDEVGEVEKIVKGKRDFSR